MKPTLEEFQRLREVFFRVSQLDPNERAGALDRECGDDPSLRALAEQLVERSDDPTEELRVIAAGLDCDDQATDVADSEDLDSSSKRIGGYRIVRKLAEGGMGIVYEAEQDQPRRTVALKVIKRGMSSPRSIRRFEHESHILGLLQHRGIAQIFDAGTADFGRGPQPFFAMEFVQGLPLIEFVKANGLSVRGRLELLAEIGEAVHHAHQKGIIHRDLKPENILVDAQAHPKVLDFGVARVIDAGVQAVTAQTEVGQIIGTISYMSPEQAAGPSEEVDIRSDVHSLGVILFQVLTDQLPYKVRGVALHEALRTLREDEPIRLSAIDRSLRGDVDAIVSKALERDRERRYQSALDLSADIRRFLRNEPVVARTPSIAYQVRKFAQRHKGVFGASTAAFVLLLLGVVGTSTGFWKAKLREQEAVTAHKVSQAARAEAERSRDESKAVTEYLASMFSSVDPERLGRDVLVRDVLDEASASVATRFADTPLIEAHLRDVIGSSYYTLGRYEAAEPHHMVATAIRKRELGRHHTLTLDSTSQWAKTLVAMGKFAAAAETFRENLDITRRVLGPEHPDTLYAMHNLAVAVGEQGLYEESEELLRQTLELRVRVLGREHPETLRTMNNLAFVTKHLGRVEEAEAMLREVLEVRKRVLGADHLDSLDTMNNLAIMLNDQGRYAEAEKMQRTGLEIRRRVLGGAHRDTLRSMNTAANALYDQGRFAQAETLHREVLETQRRILGESHPETLRTLNNLAIVLNDQGRYAEAEALFRETLELTRRELGEEHPNTVPVAINLAVAIMWQGRYADAEALNRETLELVRRIHGAEHPRYLGLMNNLGESLLLQGKLDEAEGLYRRSVNGVRRVLRDNDPDLAFPLVGLAEVLLKRGKPLDAQKLILEALQIRRAALPDSHPHVAYTESVLGECLTDLGRYAEAEGLVLLGYDRLRNAGGESGHDTVRALRRIIRLYETWGKPENAAMFEAKLAIPHGSKATEAAPSE